jgi:hypothetical protein
MFMLRCLFGLTIALLLIAPTGAWGQLPTNELEGTWKMVSQEVVYPDSVQDRSDDFGSNFKILNSTHFAWGRETKDGKEVLAGGGRYEYYPEKDLYIEHIQYHSETAFAGQTLRFDARVEGNTWFITGDLGDGVELKEVWRRVDSREVRDELYSSDSTSAAANSDMESESGEQ